jgi:hypothetical protein
MDSLVTILISLQFVLLQAREVESPHDDPTRQQNQAHQVKEPVSVDLKK